MLCPYCNGSSDFKNNSLSHKYRHSCNHYFKVCSFCHTIFSAVTSNKLTNCRNVENIFDIDICPICNRSWLPDFPTSWTRSFTNINKIYEVINDIYQNQQKNITPDLLLQIQSSHNGVIFNRERAKQRGIEQYLAGAGQRRMNEYLNVLRNMLILKSNDFNGTINHEFTKFGEELASSNDPKDILTYLILSFINIKINNGYQKPIKTSCYSYFKIRFIHNILKIINHLNQKKQGATKYQIGLAILVRNEEQFNTHCLTYINKFTSNIIKEMFFKDESELNRALVSTFLNVLESMSIIKNNNNEYFITKMGTEILTFLDRRPAIWYEDLESYSKYSGEDINKLFSYILLWRMIKNGLLNSLDLSIPVSELDKIVQNITKKKLESIDDIHLNLYYDEPLYNSFYNYSEKITSIMSTYLQSNLNLSQEEIKEFCSLLHIVWYDELSSITSKYRDVILNKFENSTKDTFRLNLQSGRKWHDKTKSLLEKLGLNVVHYKDYPCYSNITIPKLKLMLPGGTLHNPDLLIKEKTFGPLGCILVDAKDQKSINSEIPKLIGYNLYSKDYNVNSYTIIALKGKLPSSTKLRIESFKNEFDRITIIEEEALECLVTKNLSKKDILRFLLPFNGYKHITVKDIV